MPKRVLGNLKRGLVFVVSAPAGTGKTTLVRKLVDEFPCVVESISYTTRKCRGGEIPDVHYHFVTAQEFEDMVIRGEFLEYVELYGYRYGTAKESVEVLRQEGKHVVLVIDTQGALQLKTWFEGVFIFLSPPSLEVLRQRLTSRHTESEAVIQERLNWAKKELELASQYDYNIINDDLDTAYQVLRSILIAEEHKEHYGK